VLRESAAVGRPKTRFGKPLFARLLVVLLPVAAVVVAAAGGPGMDPAKGRFLVAERDLHDPNFSETVVLLVEYGDEGAMGLIINWPTAAPAAELIPHVDGMAERADTIFVGGPVARQMMLILLRSESDLAQAERVVADIHLSTNRELLQQLASGEVQVDDWRLYSGYAGWSPGQLELELKAGGWRILPAESELVFAADPDRVWSELMRRGEVQWTRRKSRAGTGVAP
jgi:putative transcriptional regulator